LGARSLDPNGLWRQKVRIGGPKLEQWKRVHHIVWEETNGPIPDGYAVAFKDGNRDNCELTNLELITTQEKNFRTAYSIAPREIADLALAVFKLKAAIRERESEEQD